jgi:D-sedoheptulose 7-phosphate isomerase
MKNNNNKEFIKTCMEEMNQVCTKLDYQAVDMAIKILLAAYRDKKTVFTVGNGGSASTASHFAADLGKFATGNQVGFRSMDVCGNYSAHTAWTNDSSWEDTWREMLKPWIVEGDVLVLFSVHGGSGWSNNLSQAIKLAKERKALTIGFSGDGGGFFAENCDVSIVVPNPVDKGLITPITESVHVMLHHTICATLRKQISNGN